jgi:hypothetical protein
MRARPSCRQSTSPATNHSPSPRARSVCRSYGWPHSAGRRRRCCGWCHGRPSRVRAGCRWRRSSRPCDVGRAPVRGVNGGPVSGGHNPLWITSPFGEVIGGRDPVPWFRPCPGRRCPPPGRCAHREHIVEPARRSLRTHRRAANVRPGATWRRCPEQPTPGGACLPRQPCPDQPADFMVPDAASAPLGGTGHSVLAVAPSGHRCWAAEESRARARSAWAGCPGDAVSSDRRAGYGHGGTGVKRGNRRHIVDQ